MVYNNGTDPYKITYSLIDMGQWDAIHLGEVATGMTSFDRPSHIIDIDYNYATYTNNAEGEKVKSAQELIGLNRIYLGGVYERDNSTAYGTVQRLFLGGTAYDAPMVLVKEGNGTWTPYNIGRDVQGSITHVMDAYGDLRETYYYDPWGNVVPMDETYASTDTLAVEEWGGTSFYSKIIGSHGYTGHEIIPGLGVYNANARLYDPVTGRFMSPDPLIQDPASTQNFNRYTYCLNNPLKYTDESGEIVWELALLAGHIAGMINLMSNTEAINNGGKWALLKYYGIGFLSGFIGSATAGAGMAPGFLGGGFSAASNSFLPAFILGYGNSALSGGNCPLASGMFAGFASATTGFLLGGLAGGIDAVKQGGNFWTGDRMVFDMDIATTDYSDIVVGDGMEYTNKYADDFFEEHFSHFVKKNGKLYSDGTIVPGHYEINGHVFHDNAEGKRIKTAGSALYNHRTKTTDVYLYRMAYISKEELYITMGHEYLHSAINSLGAKAVGEHNKQHIGIYKWEYAQAKAWNYRVDYYEQRYNTVKNHRGFDYTKFGFYVIATPIF